MSITLSPDFLVSSMRRQKNNLKMQWQYFKDVRYRSESQLSYLVIIFITGYDESFSH